mgnify:CR=1 FL=1
MSDEPESDSDDKPGKEPTKLSFSLPQLLGSAAAAMTVAYVGSSLGTAGTIFGAALASVVGAVAGTVYTAGLDRTGRRLNSVMHRGWERISTGDPELDGDGSERAEGEYAEPVGTPGTTPPAGTPSGNRKPARDKGRTWRRIALRTLAAAAAIFAVSFVAITGWELVTGRPLGGGEGTTVGQVVRPERTPTAEPEPTPSDPTESETPTVEPTEPEPAPTETVPTPQPTDTATPEPSPTPTEPTPTPAETRATQPELPAQP